MQLEEIADELYGLLPEEFTAARDRHTAELRADGDRELSVEVKALRRPAVAAWLVNAMQRHRGDEVEALLALGDALREAQSSLDADQLRELNRRRQDVLGALGRQARVLARQLGRPVIDRTGLTGRYDIKLQWTPDPGQNAAPLGGAPLPGVDPPPSDPNGPSIFAALQEQLGLRLESQKAPVELIVIDRVEKPSEN